MIGYAVKKNNSSWRTIGSTDEIETDELYSATEPVIAETYAQELTTLTAPYNADRLTLCQQWLVAAVADGTEENVRKADVEAELAELDAQYDADVAALKTKYGVN